MRILITGICGFVGTALALAIRKNFEGVEVFGFDSTFPGWCSIRAVAMKKWNWKVGTALNKILGEIADHTAKHPKWLKLASYSVFLHDSRSR